jgi:hypothetical protein
LKTFQQVKILYQRDIDEFGYREDVDLLEQIIHAAHS